MGLPLVVVGDGPLRALVPQAVGFVPPVDGSAPYYERAVVVVVPSRREGYGMVAARGDGARPSGRRDGESAGCSTRSRTA